MKIKSSQILGLVAVTHVVVICVLIMFSGCQTLKKRTVSVADPTPAAPPPPQMPPKELPAPTLRPIAPPKAVVQRPEVTTRYVVAKGDSLSAIAARFGLRVEDIATINGISDPRKLQAGQRIQLPGKIDVAKPASVSASKQADSGVEAVPAVGEGGNVYIVKGGDTLSKIARDYSVSVADIKSLNKLSDDKIRVGQKLAMPQARAGKSGDAGVQAAADPVVDQALSSVQPATSGAARAPAAEAVEPAVDAEPPAGGAVQTQTHIVGDNEDLYSVALTWGVSVSELKELNGLSGTTLKKGQRLKIPMPQ